MTKLAGVALTRRQSLLALTYAVAAGPLAMYGCGGGGSKTGTPAAVGGKSVAGQAQRICKHYSPLSWIFFSRERLVNDQPVVDAGALDMLPVQVVDRVVSKLDPIWKFKIIIVQCCDRLKVALRDVGLVAACLDAGTRIARASEAKP